MKRLVVDQRPIPFRDGDSVLVAMLRAGIHATGGGCLCLAGDCPHCLATVDGVSYVRSCQTLASPGLVVATLHRDGAAPPLFGTSCEGRPSAAGRWKRPAERRHLHCDAVVIGQGSAGRDAARELRERGREVVTLDADPGRAGSGSKPAPSGSPQEVIGIYAGPLVVARAGDEILEVHPRGEIVVATGASEIQPVAPGSHLEGLVTARAASALAVAGIDLGRVVAIGSLPDGVEATPVAGRPIRFEGEKRVESVVVETAHGTEKIPCDTVSLGLGLVPRDALYRMARDLEVRVVGDAALEPELPPCPREGTVCPCSRVTVEDLESVWQRGFRELELVKRASLAGTGACQGAACVPHVRSFLLERGEELQPPFTARPVTRQLTIGEVSAGVHHRPTPRTALHDEHLRLGARMERSSGWWRPWHYGDREAEYWAVREGVSLGDVSTLGKLVVAGPDALELLEQIYPTRIETIERGRSRYALLLDERGYVLDDGLVARCEDDRFLLTLTSGGAGFGEMWIRDWAESLERPQGGPLDVRILDRTASEGAINVTGPLAAELLRRAGVGPLPRFAGHRREKVAGVDCRIFRLSFTGELSYELHHEVADSAALWRRLLEAGRELGVRPHGVETLLDLRLEKGHVVVGKDTEYDSTPRRLAHEWAVDLEKPGFVGRQAILRTNRVALDKRLVGLEMAGPAPIDGAIVRSEGDYAGTVTSAASSPVLGKAVMLAWIDLRDGELPSRFEIDGREARRGELPFYDPKGRRARCKTKRSGATSTSAPPIESSGALDVAARRSGFRTIEAVRAVATPEALDTVAGSDSARDGSPLVLRLAADELFVCSPDLGSSVELPEIADPDAIVVRETGFSGAWLPVRRALPFLERECSWPLPGVRPAFAQGAVAGLPVKLWLEEDRVLLMVVTTLLHELEERLAASAAPSREVTS